MVLNTIKIKSTHKESQGDYVLINEQDFDSSIHSLYEPEKKVSVDTTNIDSEEKPVRQYIKKEVK